MEIDPVSQETTDFDWFGMRRGYLTPGISYFRVASPEIPLTLDALPEHVRRIVSRTFLKGVRLRDESDVPYEASLAL